jgi:quercetin dioxygenase-like cupin family protein
VQYIRNIDLDDLARTNERVSKSLLGHDSGATTCTVTCVKTPPGGGSVAGRHFHVVDQLFYIVSGTMSVEIGGDEHEAGPGSLVIFPANTPHRNWNAGSDATVHIAFNTPLPDANEPFARPAI